MSIAALVGALVLGALATSARGEPWRLVRAGDESLHVIADGVRHRIAPAAIAAAELAAVPEGEPWGTDFTASAPPPPAAEPAAASAEPASQTLGGQGSRATDPITLRKGLAVARGSHSGRRSFVAQLVDGQGNNVALLANEIGDATSTRAVGVPADGQYVVNVRADGQWGLAIDQPSPTAGASLPQTFTGRGSDVTEFMQLPDGLVTARAEHGSGRRNFVVQAVGLDGQNVELLANAVGPARARRAFNGRGRIVLLTVQADGDWRITLE